MNKRLFTKEGMIERSKEEAAERSLTFATL